MDEEIWKSVVGFEGIYEVSNHARVRRIGRGKSTHPGRILKATGKRPAPHLPLRWSVSLSGNGKYLTIDVHKIVARAFLGQVPEGKEVNHLDGNPSNNRPGNLEYCTRRENVQHAYRLGLMKAVCGEEQGLSKLTTEQVIVIKNCTAPVRLIARVFGVKHSTVRAIQTAKTWKHV